MNAPIAAIASKIRMKRNGTKIRCISDVIHGLVQRFLDMRQPSMFPQRDLTKLIPADTVEKISHGRGYLHPLHQVIKSQSPRNKIGRYE